MRAFIAIDFPVNIKGRLTKIQDQLKASKADVKWVKPENIHLTLKFLGERDEKKLDKVISLLEDIAKTKGSFCISIGSLGAFPEISSPRVIWVGIDKGDNAIKAIVEELEEKISTLGIPKEDRPFSCHITIGRAKSYLNRDGLVAGLKELADSFKGEGLEFLADSITLFKSTLTPQGPVYEALKEVTLKSI